MGLRFRFTRGTEDRTLAPPVDDRRGPWIPVLADDVDPSLSTSPLARITTANVLAVADAYACVRVLADSISTLPLKVYRRTDLGRVPAGDQSRAVQLLGRPSPGSTGVDLVSQIVTHLNVHGDCFIGKYRGADGEIVQLGCIDPNRIAVELDGQRIVYVLDAESEHGPADIIHIKAMSFDGVRGLSPVAQCRVAFGLNEDLRESSRQYFKQGSRPSGILSVAGGGTDKLEAVTERWNEKHAGVQNMHRVAVLAAPDLKFTPIAFSANDSQFLEQREFSTREVCRIFRVPAWAVDGATGDSLTYANTLEQSRALVTYSLRPWIVRIERALSNDADLCPGATYVEVDLDGLLRADASTRSDVYTKALNGETGWMSRAEVRELEQLPPEGEGEGG